MGPAKSVCTMSRRASVLSLNKLPLRADFITWDRFFTLFLNVQHFLVSLYQHNFSVLGLHANSAHQGFSYSDYHSHFLMCADSKVCYVHVWGIWYRLYTELPAHSGHMRLGTGLHQEEEHPHTDQWIFMV